MSEQLCEPQADRQSIAIRPGDIKEHWYDVGRAIENAYPVGSSERGYDANWPMIPQRPFSWGPQCRREITRPKRRFWFNPGDYVIATTQRSKIPGGDVFYCGAEQVVLLGSTRADFRDDVGDLVIAHHNPEQMRFRLIRRADQMRWMESGKTFTTKRGGPLEGLAEGQRFAFSWGDGATVTKLGPRVTYFRPDRYSERGMPVDRHLTSAETKIVTDWTAHVRGL